MTSHEKRALMNEVPEYKLREYIQPRNKRTYTIYDSISWTVYGAAKFVLSDIGRASAIKFSHGWLTVGVGERYCGAETDICPQCSQP
jgi:hypothetical protein